LVLCYLQGHSGDIAARALALSPQALRKRLERAREMLRARLLRRGLGNGPATAALTTMLAGHSPAAVLAPKLVSAITRAATTGTAAPAVLKLAASASPGTATSLLPALGQLTLLMKTKTILTAAACAALLVPASMLLHDLSQASNERQQAETRNPETHAREMNKRSGDRPRTRQPNGPQDPWLSIRSLTPEEAARIIREKEGQPSLEDYMQEPAKMRALLAEMGYNQNQIGALMRMLGDIKMNLISGQDFPPSLCVVLNRFREFLFLPGLSTLDAATATALASGNVEILSLAGLSTLDAATATALASGDVDILHLAGLSTLDAATATALASGNVEILFLDGLSTLDAATATALVSGNGNLLLLSLSGLSTLDAATATALASGKVGFLSLSGLNTLDAATALASGNVQILHLPGLSTLDAATASALASGAVQFFLPSLSTLDAATATALTSGKVNTLSLPGLSTLNAATATALASGNLRHLELNGLSTLDDATATALASGKVVWLYLNGLSTLDAATATALASGEVNYLHLRGLSTLKPAAVEELARSGIHVLSSNPEIYSAIEAARERHGN
jgi:hypothetical protein